MEIKDKKSLLELITNKEYGILQSATFNLDDTNENQKGWYRGFLAACNSIYNSIDKLY